MCTNRYHQDVQWIQVTLPPIQRRARASLGRIIMIFMQHLQHGPVKVEMKPWVFCSTETWNFASVNSSQWGLREWPGARTQLWGEGVWCDHSATGAYDQVVPKKPLGRGFFRCILVVRKSINSWPVKNTSRFLGNDSAWGPPQSFLLLMREFLQVLLVHLCTLEQTRRVACKCNEWIER